ncbi:MAG: MFS transporter [Chloroflexi bacterium]|nr:MFS transporter [Chloroflexota bacterium]
MVESAESTLHVKKDIRESGGFIISGLASGHVLFHWFVQSFLVVLPEIQATFHLNGVGVGAILAVRELASGIVTLPGGVVVDMLRRRWGMLLAGCIGAFSLGSLLMGISPVYPLLLVGVAIVGMSHSIWHLAASASLSHHFSNRRGMALSFHGVGGSIGDVAGPVATGALLIVLGWRGILSMYAIAPFFLAFLAVWSFRSIGRDTEAKVEVIDRRARVEMTRSLLKSPVLWGITLVRGLRGMALVALLTLLPLYLDSELGLSTFARGFHIGLLIAIGIVAKPIMGHLSDRIGRKQVLLPGLLWSCAFAFLLIPYGQGFALTAVIAALGMFLYPDQPILTAAIFDIVPRDVATTALGIGGSVGFIMSALSPLIAGGLYETLGVDAALYYVVGLFALAATTIALLPLKPMSRAEPEGLTS